MPTLRMVIHVNPCQFLNKKAHSFKLTEHCELFKLDSLSRLKLRHGFQMMHPLQAGDGWVMSVEHPLENSELRLAKNSVIRQKKLKVATRDWLLTAGVSSI